MKTIIVLFSCFLLCQIVTSSAETATIAAESCSRDHVNTAIGASAHGDTITIPDGSCTWTSGVDVNKRVMIQALNSTPVQYGRSTQSVIILNNSSTPLFTLTTGDDYHTGLRGIRFNEGTRTSNHIYASGSGTKIALLNDIYMEQYEKFGTASLVASIRWDALGGIWWDTYFYGKDAVQNYGGEAIRISSPKTWATASTMGTLDTGGLTNLYVEDCTFQNTRNSFDFDTNSRVVVRYSHFDCSNATHHGLTSNPGARHTEWYNNTFSNTVSECNIGERYLWVRGGTTIMTGNVVNNDVDTGSYIGDATQIVIGENGDDYGSYPPSSAPTQYMPGWGHNGSAYISDPIYIWSNTGIRAGTYGWISAYWEGMVAITRDLIITGAKPDYVSYTYPHPLRGGGSPATGSHRGVSISGGVSIR